MYDSFSCSTRIYSTSLLDPDIRIQTQNYTIWQNAAIEFVARYNSQLIIALLVNADLVVVTVNVYIGTLVTSLSIVNVATTVPSAKSIVVTCAPNFTMTHTCVSRTDSIFHIIISIIVTYGVASVYIAMFWIIIRGHLM